jgi:phage-related minor tail protein
LKRFHTHKDYKLWSEQQPDETQEQAQGQCFRPEQKQKQIEAQMQIPKDRTRHRDQQQANVLDQNKIEAQLQIPQEALATDRTRHRDQQQASVLDLGNKIEASSKSQRKLWLQIGLDAGTSSRPTF